MNLALSLAELIEKLGSEHSVPMRERYCQVLGIADNTQEFHTALAVTYGRMIELKSRINESPLSDRSKSVFVGAVENLLPFTDMAALNAYSTDHLRNLTDKIHLLHIASDAMPDTYIVDIQPVTLEALVQELEDLRALSQQAKIEPELKRLIEDSINTLLMVMRSYRQFGPDGAARIYGSVAAEIARVAVQSPPKSEEGRSALANTLKTFRKVAGAIILAGATVTGADELLRHGTHLISEFRGTSESAPDTLIELADETPGDSA